MDTLTALISFAIGAALAIHLSRQKRRRDRRMRFLRKLRLALDACPLCERTSLP